MAVERLLWWKNSWSGWWKYCKILRRHCFQIRKRTVSDISVSQDVTEFIKIMKTFFREDFSIYLDPVCAFHFMIVLMKNAFHDKSRLLSFIFRCWTILFLQYVKKFSSVAVVCFHLPMLSFDCLWLVGLLIKKEKKSSDAITVFPIILSWLKKKKKIQMP